MVMEKHEVILNELKAFHNPVVVEIGTIKTKWMNLKYGYATFFIASYLKEIQRGVLVSVDISPRCINVARSVLEADDLMDGVTLVQGTGEDIIPALDVETIDLLYLDGSNHPISTLNQLKVAMPKLSSSSIVVIDDCGSTLWGRMGKGTFVNDFAIENGFSVEIVETKHQPMMVLKRN